MADAPGETPVSWAEQESLREDHETLNQRIVDEDDEDSSSESESDDEPVAPLATTRERRANAGNRLAKLLSSAREENRAALDIAAAVATSSDADEAELERAVFEEVEGDEDFASDDDEDIRRGSDDDDDMSSSSSGEESDGEEDDKKEKDAADDDVGQKLGLVENRRKRKGGTRESLLQKTMRLRRIKYNLPGPSTTTGTADEGEQQATEVTAMPPPPRPKRKAEKLATAPADGAIRASRRKATQMNSQVTAENSKISAQRRRELLVTMAKAEERKKAANPPKVLTQEERLAQAAEVEEQNSKSLNRWEESEKRRIEEQRAKLEALKNRKLHGPVITYWSGPSVWFNEKLKQVGKSKLVEEIETERDGRAMKKEIDLGDQAVDIPSPDADVLESAPASPGPPDDTIQREDVAGAIDNKDPNEMEESSHSRAEAMDIDTVTIGENDARDGPQNAVSDAPSFLSGIEEWAKAPEQPGTDVSQVFPPTLSDVFAQSAVTTPKPPSAPIIRSLARRSLLTLSSFAHLPPSKREQRFKEQEDAAIEGDALTNTTRYSRHHDNSLLRALFTVPPANDQENAVLVEATSHSLTPEALHAYTKSLISLPEFRAYDPSNPGTSRSSQRYLSKREARCIITGQVVRYRDPGTGIPYANSAAFKVLKKVRKGVASGKGGVWSEFLQAWVGEPRPAKGVPEEVWLGKRKAIPAQEDTEAGAEQDIATTST